MNNYMNYANDLAKQAFHENEVPVGCIIIHKNKIIAATYNTRENTQDLFAHAELKALKSANIKLQTWKLADCEMYVTVEPCLMCYGAIIQSRIKKVYIGSIQDEKKSSSYKGYINNDLIIDESLINDTSKKLMQDLFIKLRGKKC